MHSNTNGPPPLRSAAWPRGLPGLSGSQQEQVRRANVLADFAIEAMESAAQSGAVALLEFPEDLGTTARATPASIWRDPDMKKLHDLGAIRAAIYQDDWAQVPYLKPTGLLLVRADALVGDVRVKVG